MSELNNMNALIVSGSALIGLVGYLIKINNHQSERLKRIESSIVALKNEMHTSQSPTNESLTRCILPKKHEESDTPFNTTVDFSTFTLVERENNNINI